MTFTDTSQDCVLCMYVSRTPESPSQGKYHMSEKVFFWKDVLKAECVKHWDLTKQINELIRTSFILVAPEVCLQLRDLLPWERVNSLAL